MKLLFCKYQGTGNDFVLIDNRKMQWELDSKIISKLCHRRFGIGADGLMLLQNHKNFDFEMKYYNSDGNIGSMCGNGGRCIVAFAKKLNIFDSETKFLASDGEHQAKILSSESNKTLVRLKMQDVDEIKQRNKNSYFLNTGSPHHVQYVENIDSFNIFETGRKIRYSDEYLQQNGTNVNFVEIKDNKIFIRTYERGVEDETYSCGTGVTAAALTFSLLKPELQQIDIETLGGLLSVRFEKTTSNGFKNIYLQGPVEEVFEGIIEI